MSEKLEGTVVFFSVERAFGFIVRRDASNQLSRYFFHLGRVIHSDVEPKDIREGLFARFEVSPVPLTQGSNKVPGTNDVEIYLQDPKTQGGLTLLAGESQEGGN